MRLAPRTFAYVALAGLAVIATGCSSNNKGKIEGKWKVVSGPGFEPTFKLLESIKAAWIIEFKPDGTLVSAYEASDPGTKDAIAKQAETAAKTGKYALKAGDKVEFSGPDDKGGGFFGKSGKEYFNVSIDGDTMTITASDGNMKLIRVK